MIPLPCQFIDTIYIHWPDWMLFILSGGEKLLDLKYLALVIAEYQILPPFLIPAVAVGDCELAHVFPY